MDLQRGGVLSRNMAKLEAKVRKTRIHALPIKQEVRWLYVNHLASFFSPNAYYFCYLCFVSFLESHFLGQTNAPNFKLLISLPLPLQWTHPIQLIQTLRVICTLHAMLMLLITALLHIRTMQKLLCPSALK